MGKALTTLSSLMAYRGKAGRGDFASRDQAEQAALSGCQSTWWGPGSACLLPDKMFSESEAQVSSESRWRLRMACWSRCDLSDRLESSDSRGASEGTAFPLWMDKCQLIVWDDSDPQPFQWLKSLLRRTLPEQRFCQKAADQDHALCLGCWVSGR